MKKLIIFDLDGTILNTISDMTNSMNYLLNYLKASLITEDDMKGAMNKGRRYLIETALGRKISDEENSRYQKIYNDYYFSNKNILTKPYDGIVTLLDNLKNAGYLLAVCSNKLHNATAGLVEEIFPNTFDYVLGSSNKFSRKPHPEMLVHILQELDVNKDNTIYIGDTEADMKAASNADIYKIAALYGFGEKEKLLKHNPDAVVDKPEEIYDLVIKHFK
ncbi:MAG: HAD family hydrolase [Acholeplasmataceae bacterium]|jgi:phosphoglycolate phosphatase|nr:HAD family hydrolase [Acholeplasmataceae bacterium]